MPRELQVRRIIDIYDSILTKIENFFMMIASLLTLGMLIVVSYGVIGRFFFNQPTAWTVELSEYLMVYICFLSVPWILTQGGHVHVDLVLNAVNQRTQRWLSLFTLVIALLSCLLLFWFSLHTVIEHYQRNVITVSILQLPEYLMMIPIPVGSLFLALRFLYQIFRLIQER